MELNLLKLSVVVLGLGSIVGTVYAITVISGLKQKLRTIKRNLTEYSGVAEYKLDEKTGTVRLKLKTSTAEEKAKAIDYILDELRD
jgi:hypothetical protein